MPVHPIEYRYNSPEMYKIWTDESRLQYALTVEAALAVALAKNGLIPQDAAKTIVDHANLNYVKLARVEQLEEKTQHDVMAMVLAISEQCGDAGHYVHFGATSADITDTAASLQLRDALQILDKRITVLLRVLLVLADTHKNTVCIGRTHGQHAIPTTYGMKFIRWAAELERHLTRLDQLRPRLLRAKLSGAVGTMAGFKEKGFELQTAFAIHLKLNPVDVASQVIPRDSYAEYICWSALVAATLETISKEIRNLQRTEIAELAEPFGASQVGSSTMAQKRNPHKSERICGLARILRGFISPAVEDIALEHERDLTNSSPERILLPESSILLDYLLIQMTKILQGLEFNTDNITRNLNLTQGQACAERVMLELTQRGLGRQDAHEVLRQASIKARNTNQPLLAILEVDPKVMAFASRSDLAEWLNPQTYIGTAPQQVTNLVKRISKNLSARETP